MLSTEEFLNDCNSSSEFRRDRNSNPLPFSLLLLSSSSFLGSFFGLGLALLLSLGLSRLNGSGSSGVSGRVVGGRDSGVLGLLGDDGGGGSLSLVGGHFDWYLWFGFGLTCVWLKSGSGFDVFDDGDGDGDVGRVKGFLYTLSDNHCLKVWEPSVRVMNNRYAFAVAWMLLL